MHNAVAMPSAKTRKRAPKATDSTPSNTLGLAEEEAILTPNPIPLIEPTNVEPPNASPYPLEPLNSNDTKAQTQGDKAGKEEKLL